MTAFSRLVRPFAATPHSLPAGKVVNAYGFPTDADGSGQTVAIVELGGAYSPSDLSLFCSGSGIAVPSVTAKAVGGASIVADPGGADVEVMLDVEVVAAAAPGAKQVVFFGDNTDAGFLDAINAAIALNPCAISISWGGPESSWSTATMRAFDTAFMKAAAAGIAVFCAAGDNGDLDGTGKKVADFPASSPNVFACGGTRLTLDASGARLSEIPWDDSGDSATGGGFSGLFARPTWQPTSVGSHRGLPDLAGNADPMSGFQMVTEGQWTVVGGTSAVAPLMAGLWARLCQLHGANITSAAVWLYANTTAFVDIVGTGHDIYPASTGWDAATGLGVPVGTILASRLGSTTPPPPPPVPVPPAPAQPDPADVLLAQQFATFQADVAAWMGQKGISIGGANIPQVGTSTNPAVWTFRAA
ncbi:S8 family serine peptidase [Frankia sp. AgW1.1]|uniref:S53 family peptidase n=1 Tax=Frankia sp. AgW1.1 TaxID=1836971 RepID=UPI0019342581|nr:S53 family peptidase [Frankia sp. AgW1.1]MBL7487066.1 S53 family peptidase [Frankia sp. AgW1.1]